MEPHFSPQLLLISNGAQTEVKLLRKDKFLMQVFGKIILFSCLSFINGKVLQCNKTDQIYHNFVIGKDDHCKMGCKPGETDFS